MPADPMTLEEITKLPPLVDITTAARALTISRSCAYELIREGAFPVPVLKVSARNLRVKASDLRAYLGVDFPTSEPLTA